MVSTNLIYFSLREATRNGILDDHALNFKPGDQSRQSLKLTGAKQLPLAPALLPPEVQHQGIRRFESHTNVLPFAVRFLFSNRTGFPLVQGIIRRFHCLHIPRDPVSAPMGSGEFFQTLR